MAINNYKNSNKPRIIHWEVIPSKRGLLLATPGSLPKSNVSLEREKQEGVILTFHPIFYVAHTLRARLSLDIHLCFLARYPSRAPVFSFSARFPPSPHCVFASALDHVLHLYPYMTKSRVIIHHLIPMMTFLSPFFCSSILAPPNVERDQCAAPWSTLSDAITSLPRPDARTRTATRRQRVQPPSDDA